MPLTKMIDLAYGRLRAPDLDVAEEFLTNFGMVRAERTPTALYMRGTDPAPHIHVTEKGEPGFVGLAYYAASLDDLKRLASSPGASAAGSVGEAGGGERGQGGGAAGGEGVAGRGSLRRQEAQADLRETAAAEHGAGFPEARRHGAALAPRRVAREAHRPRRHGRARRQDHRGVVPRDA